MKITEINKVCFVGAGTMGCANSLVSALAGYTVVVYDVAQDMLEQFPARQQEMATYMLDNGLCAAEDIPLALQRITLSSNLEEAAIDVDLVSESVFEQLDVKRAIHKRLDQVFPAKTIVTTNTSALLVSEIEDVVQRGDLFAALHSHLGSPLFDIVGGPRTSSATIDTLKRYVESIGGVPLLLKKENQGYVLNAMLGPLLSMATLLVAEGAASIEQVDRAWMVQRNAPVGPFGMMDSFGLNVVFDSWQNGKAGAGAEQAREKTIAFLASYIDCGELGVKTGKGFYSYPEPGYQQTTFLSDPAESTIPYAALISVLIQNAILIADKGVAEPEDIDRAWKTATALDSGPFEILAAMGVDAFLQLQSEQAETGNCSTAIVEQVGSWLQCNVTRQKNGH